MPTAKKARAKKALKRHRHQTRKIRTARKVREPNVEKRVAQIEKPIIDEVVRKAHAKAAKAAEKTPQQDPKPVKTGGALIH